MSNKKILTVFYDWASPPSRAVIAFTKLAHLPNVKYEEVRLTKNQHLSNEFKAINPLSQLPAIREESEDTAKPFYLSESHAILRYLCFSRPD
jgi:glutathione S-transferase